MCAFILKLNFVENSELFSPITSSGWLIACVWAIIAGLFEGALLEAFRNAWSGKLVRRATPSFKASNFS